MTITDEQTTSGVHVFPDGPKHAPETVIPASVAEPKIAPEIVTVEHPTTAPATASKAPKPAEPPAQKPVEAPAKTAPATAPVKPRHGPALTADSAG